MPIRGLSPSCSAVSIESPWQAPSNCRISHLPVLESSGNRDYVPDIPLEQFTSSCASSWPLDEPTVSWTWWDFRQQSCAVGMFESGCECWPQRLLASAVAGSLSSLMLALHLQHPKAPPHTPHLSFMTTEKLSVKNKWHAWVFTSCQTPHKAFCSVCLPWSLLTDQHWGKRRKSSHHTDEKLQGQRAECSRIES